MTDRRLVNSRARDILLVTLRGCAYDKDRFTGLVFCWISSVGESGAGESDGSSVEIGFPSPSSAVDVSTGDVSAGDVSPSC